MNNVRTEHLEIAEPSSSKTLVTVVLNFYNEEKYLKSSIESILQQSYDNIEILLIDDCSTDGSGDIASYYASSHTRIRLIKNEIKRGLAYGRNVGIREARGEYVAFQDGDDFSKIDRILVEAEYLDAHEDVVAVSGGMQYIDEKGRELDLRFDEYIDDESLKAMMLFRNVFPNPASMIRRSLFTDNGVVQNEGYLCAQDYDFWNRCIIYGNLHFIPKVLVCYRVHESHSRSFEKNNEQKYASWIKSIIRDGWRFRGIDLSQDLIDYIYIYLHGEKAIWRFKEIANYMELDRVVNASHNNKIERDHIIRVHHSLFNEHLIHRKLGKKLKLIITGSL